MSTANEPWVPSFIRLASQTSNPEETIEPASAQIPASGLLLMVEVSQFAFLQDPQQFNDDVLHFMAHVPEAK